MLLKGQWNVFYYKSFLREVYHYSKEDPQIQALASVYFRGADRQQVKPFFRHAISEIGHDLMALEDLRKLGEDISLIPETRPLPATIAFTAFPFYQINYDNPIGYLGYLYFLEYMPTHYGQQYAEGFIRCGVPKEALGFLHEHTTVDLTHNQFMENYLEALVHDESDLKAVIYAMQVTGELYAQMIWAAIQRVESGIDYGTISYETKRIRSH